MSDFGRKSVKVSAIFWRTCSKILSDIVSEYFSKLYQVLGEKICKFLWVLEENFLKLFPILGEKSLSIFLWFCEKIFLKFSPVLGRKSPLTFLSFRRQFLMSFSQFLETVHNDLFPILETVSTQFSSILKIVFDEFPSFFEDSFCKMNSPTFRKLSTISSAINESHSDRIGQWLSRACRLKNWITVLT